MLAFRLQKEQHYATKPDTGSSWWTDANRLTEFHKHMLFFHKIWNVSLTLNTICNNYSNWPLLTSLRPQWTEISGSTQIHNEGDSFVFPWSGLYMMLGQPLLSLPFSVFKYIRLKCSDRSCLHTFTIRSWKTACCPSETPSLIPVLAPGWGVSPPSNLSFSIAWIHVLLLIQYTFPPRSQ